MSFGRQTEWRYVVTDLDGRHITTMDAHARDRSISYGLNQPTLMTGTISSDSPEINRLDLDGFPLLAEGDRLLYCLRRDYDGVADQSSSAANPPWICRAAGIILQYDDAAASEDGNTTFTAYDPWEYLNHLRYINPENVDASGRLDYTYSQTEVQLIIEHQLNLSALNHNTSWDATDPVRNMFLDWGQLGVYVQDWDILPEITHTVQKGTMIGDLFRDLCERGRLDIVLVPIYDPVERPGILAEVHVYDIAGVLKPEAIFAWDKPSHSLQQISRQVDGTRRTNYVNWHTWLGGTDVEATPGISQLSIDRFGEYWSDQTIVASEHTGQTEDFQDAFLDTYAEHAREVTLTSIPERCPEPFLEWYLGDWIQVYASNNLRATMSGFQRVSAFTIDIDDENVETVADLRIYITDQGVDLPEEQGPEPIEAGEDDINEGDDPPELISAVGLDSTVTLSYNVGLLTAFTPSPSDFAVLINASPVTETAVSVSGQNVTITIATPIVAGDTVTISYTPGASPITSVRGTQAAALVAESVDTGTVGGGGGELGAARNILTFRVTGQGNDTGGGVPGLSFHWLYATSPNTPRTNGGNAGRYFVEDETWFMIMGIKPGGTTRLGRVFNWHDMPFSGYIWGSVSPVAHDRGSRADTEGNTVGDWFTMQYGSSANKHTSVPFVANEWNWEFVQIYLHRTNGSVQVYLSNSARNATVSSTPLVNLSGVPTLNPNTAYYPGVQFWQGLYTTNDFSTATYQAEHMAAMVGSSWNDAWKDTPTRVTDLGSPGSSYTTITSVSTGDIIVPNVIAAQIVG